MKADCTLTPRLVSDLVPFWAKQTPDAVALSDSVRSWTYAELDAAISAAANVLNDAGVRPGDRVLLVCENGTPAVVLYFASIGLRAWPVIVNARLADRELDEIHRHCGARLALFTSDGSLHALRHAQKNHAAPVAGLSGVMVTSIDHHAIPEPAEAESGNEVAALIYTSGTTGRPKGVMLSHGNLLFAATGSAKVRRLSPADRVLSVLPISHILGLSGVLLGSFASGAEVQLLARFDPAALLQKLENAGTTVLVGTPAMYAMVAEFAERKGIRRIAAPALRVISTAGAPLDAATKTRAETAFGQPLRNGYGVTECSPTITLGDMDSPLPDCSVGRALAGIETRIVNAAGDDAGADAIGELWVRGPGVMKGYYRAPEETSLAIDADGWFRTGDLARVANENFHIVGRSKEMLIRFGFNVYPAEIEGVLNSHPCVARSAVLGFARNGEEDIAAFVELRSGTKTKTDELAEYSARQLAPYKRPSEYILVDALPLTPAGKVLKSALAAQLAEAS
jgi:acyl-CoA synthetase (AMP-forming)/AMP-acid ligase II